MVNTIEKKKYKSLAEYIYLNYEKVIKAELIRFFKEHSYYGTKEEWDEPDKYGFSVVDIKLIEPRLYQFWADNNSLDFDMVVHAVTTIQCMVEHEYQLNYFENDFTFTMHGTIGGGKLSIGHKDICAGINKRPYNNAKSLNQFLVPFISAELYEVYATEILIRYFPEALEKPTKINPIKFAHKLGLNVEFGPLPPSCYGKIVFADEKGTIYDFDSQELVETIIPKNTIIISYNSLEKHRAGNITNTILHECVHKYLHQNYFELQSLLNSGETSLNCYASEMENPSSEKIKNKYFMEIQAKAIAPKILMPATQAKKKFVAILRELKRSGRYYQTQLFDNAVMRFAEFFGTSIESSIIRLNQLGFSKAITSSKNSSHKIIKSYRSRVLLKSGETFTISESEAMEAMVNNADFYKLVSNSVFIYVDGMFVLNDNKYVKKYKIGGARLTGLALQDVSKCCLKFNKRIRSTTINFSPQTFNMMMFFSGGYTTEHKIETVVSLKSGSNKNVFDTARVDGTREAIHLEYQHVKEIVTNLQSYDNFAGKFTYLLSLDDYKGISERKIGETCRLDGKTIASYKKGSSIPNQNRLYAICGGLRLHPIISSSLFNYFGWSLQLNCEDKKIAYYNFLLQTKYLEGLAAWNESIKDQFPNDASAFLP